MHCSPDAFGADPVVAGQGAHQATGVVGLQR